MFQVTDILSWLFHKYGSNAVKNSRLCRIHFHSLTFHMIGTVPGTWSNSVVAVTMGTQIAGLQACDRETFHLNDVDLRFPETYSRFTGGLPVRFNSKKPVVSFSHRDLDFSLSPVLVCREPLKTVGLGDAISATGLIHSKFTRWRS